ncbi:MAG: LuxR C-terminal-related transcriptional regulator [Bacillus sp. (in: Bacteria)]|nr:LuxR C-terminal-related transcriptional regulator [Bacillus sp. (in: firmicutes)]MCM1427348.1 LuxR C-terminal-related transcriptional regulator [Eubacterium sp.]
MKYVKKLIAVFIYILIMSVLLEFKLAQLFNVKQLILVIIGMAVLFLPAYKRTESVKYYIAQLGKCALLAGYIQTFILLFIAFSTQMDADNIIPEIAKNCRPVLYGLALSLIFSDDTEKAKKDKESAKDSSNEEPMSATQVYEAYRSLGLTNREAELAIRIEQGLSNAEIAAQLCISETTVKKHISNIFEKLEVGRREQIKEKRKAL